MISDMQNPAGEGGACGIVSHQAGRNASQDTAASADAQYLLIAKIRKNAREEFRVAIRKFANFRGVELRLYQVNGCGEFVETPRAIAMRMQALPAIIDGLQMAAAAYVASLPDSANLLDAQGGAK
jgi:hypothetical protein